MDGPPQRQEGAADQPSESPAVQDQARSISGSMGMEAMLVSLISGLKEEMASIRNTLGDLSRDVGQLKLAVAANPAEANASVPTPSPSSAKLSLALLENENRRWQNLGQEISTLKTIHHNELQQLQERVQGLEKSIKKRKRSDDEADQEDEGKGVERKNRQSDVEEEEEAERDTTSESPSTIRRSARLRAKGGEATSPAKPKRIAKRTKSSDSAPAPQEEPPAKRKRGRPRKMPVLSDEEEAKAGSEDALPPTAMDVQSIDEEEDGRGSGLEIAEEDEEEKDEDALRDGEQSEKTLGQNVILDAGDKELKQSLDAKAVMQLRRERRRAELDKERGDDKKEAAAQDTQKQKKQKAKEGKQAKELVQKTAEKVSSAEPPSVSNATDDALATPKRTPSTTKLATKEGRLLKSAKAKAKAEQSMRSRQLARPSSTAASSTASVSEPPSVQTTPSASPPLTSKADKPSSTQPSATAPTPPTTPARVAWPPPPPSTPSAAPRVTWPPPPPSTPSASPSRVAWPPPPLASSTGPSGIVKPLPSVTTTTSSTASTPTHAAPPFATSTTSRDRKADESTVDYFNRRVSPFNATTLKDIAVDFANAKNLEEQEAISLIERRMMQILSTERTKREDRAWMTQFFNQEKLILRLLWHVALARSPSKDQAGASPVLDRIFCSWASRIVKQDRKQGMADGDRELLCKAFAGLCKMHQKTGRSVISLLCLDLIQSFLVQHDSKLIPGPRKKPRAELVLQRLRILSRAYPGILCPPSDADEDGDGLATLAATIRLIINSHLSEEAKSGNGTGVMKRDRLRLVEDCLADLAEDNRWTDANDMHLDQLLARIRTSFEALPTHTSDELYGVEPRTFVEMKCLELLALWKGWVWCFNDLIIGQLWNLFGSSAYSNSAQVTAMRAVGQLASVVLRFTEEPVPLSGSQHITESLAGVLKMDPEMRKEQGITFSAEVAMAQTILALTGGHATDGDTVDPTALTLVRAWVNSLPTARAQQLPTSLLANTRAK